MRARLATRSQAEHNERVIYAEAVFQAIASAGAFSFMSVFLVRLGAPNWLVGLFSSLPALVTIIAVLPAAGFVQRQRSLLGVINWTRFIFRAATASFALLPLLPRHIAPFVMVGMWSLMSVPDSALNIATTTVWGLVTPSERRPRLLSTRLAIHGLFVAGLGYVAGRWLDATPYPLNYQALFVSAFVAGLGSIYMMSRLRIDETSRRQAAARRRLSLRATWALIQGAPAFRGFALASFVFRMSLSMPSALYSIYRVRTLGASDAWIGVLVTIESLLSVVAYFILGRLSAKPWFRKWMWVTCLGAMLYPLSMGLTRTPEMLFIPSIIAGLFGAGMNIYLTDRLLQVSPEGDRPAFVAANSLLANITAFTAPMIGTALADAIGINTTFFVIAGTRIIGGLLLGRVGRKQEEA